MWETKGLYLQFNDILIIFEDSGNIKDYGFLTGLRNSGVRVQTVTDGSDLDVEHNDCAWAMDIDHLLKYRTNRKILVYVEKSSECQNAENKVLAFSHCTSQLVVVNRKPKSIFLVCYTWHFERFIYDYRPAILMDFFKVCFTKYPWMSKQSEYCLLLMFTGCERHHTVNDFFSQTFDDKLSEQHSGMNIHDPLSHTHFLARKCTTHPGSIILSVYLL